MKIIKVKVILFCFSSYVLFQFSGGDQKLLNSEAVGVLIITLSNTHSIQCIAD